uniref:C-type lectin domain-containing protein n=1 Tax=Sphenodon punctatus TaxID=8508 RepID=A0A8D0H7P6_SPHPU
MLQPCPPCHPGLGLAPFVENGFGILASESVGVISTRGCNPAPDRPRLMLCAAAVSAFPLPDGSECKLCPSDWLLHGDKCYWLSKESQVWVKSQEDCLEKGSQMLVIRTQKEMVKCKGGFKQEFIRNTTQERYLVWTGLTVKPPGRQWVWVDGSNLNLSLFPVKGSAEGSSCGVIKGDRIQSETCGGEYRWICQKEAALFTGGRRDPQL